MNKLGHDNVDLSADGSARDLQLVDIVRTWGRARDVVSIDLVKPITICASVGGEPYVVKCVLQRNVTAAGIANVQAHAIVVWGTDVGREHDVLGNKPIKDPHGGEETLHVCTITAGAQRVAVSRHEWIRVDIPGIGIMTEEAHKVPQIRR